VTKKGIKPAVLELTRNSVSQAGEASVEPEKMKTRNTKWGDEEEGRMCDKVLARGSARGARTLQRGEVWKKRTYWGDHQPCESGVICGVIKKDLKRRTGLQQGGKEYQGRVTKRISGKRNTSPQKTRRREGRRNQTQNRCAKRSELKKLQRVQRGERTLVDAIAKKGKSGNLEIVRKIYPSSTKLEIDWKLKRPSTGSRSKPPTGEFRGKIYRGWV